MPYQLLLLVLVAFSGPNVANAQIQFPGKPAGISTQLKAADVMYVLPPLDPLRLESALQSDNKHLLKSYEFAMERRVNLSPDSHGSWEQKDQYRIWRVHVVSPGALSLGLVFNKYNLEPGVKLFAYNPGQEHVRGAFTSGNNKKSGILPVGHIPGDEVIIEMQVPQELPGYGELKVESVSHAFRGVKQNFETAECPAGEFGCSQACEIDVNCTEGDNWQSAKRSVVRVYTTRFYCTGVLVNNTDYDGTPYIITAEHCLNKQYYADRTVFQFGYESPDCYGGDGPLNMSVSGAELLAHGDSIDFSLVKLSLAPPDSFNAYYAGWDRSDFQTSATTTIHHPWGDVKKISSDTDAPSIPTHPGDVPYSDLDDYHYFSFWWIRQWDSGTTEGGSSGSPLFNAGQRLIGTLSGGIAKCGDSIGYDSDNDRVIYNQAFNYDDYYTRLSMAWDYYGDNDASLKPWLDPGNTGVETIGGYLPNSVDPGTQFPGSRFSLFPNPANETLFVSSSGTLPGMDLSYGIYNHSGALLLSGNMEKALTTRIETASLTPGLFVIRIEGPEFHEAHKFIVNR